MGFFSFLKADKKQDPKQGAGIANPLIRPHDDIFKAYIPNFLYKPPFGYPLNKNVVQLKEMAKNAYIFSVIRTLKEEASATKWEIRIKKEFAEEFSVDNFKEPIKTVSDFFYNPNGNEESFTDIVGQWITDLCEVDAAVGVKVFNQGGKFSQLFARDGGAFLRNPDIYGYLGNRNDFVMPNEYVGATINPDSIKQYNMAYGDQAAYYQYGWTGNALPVPFGKREIVYIMMHPRGDSMYGRSPLEILYDTLLTLIYGQQYNLDFYLNGNTPDGLILLEGADQQVAEAFQERLKNKYTVFDGLQNQRRVGHVYPVYGGPKADFIPFSLSARDMEIIEQQKWFIKLVWMAFGVTPDEMGETQDSNRSSGQTQSAVHKRKALRPLLMKIQYAINTQIMPELDPSGKLEFAWEDYDLDDDIKKHSLYKLQVDMGIKSPEMVAEEEGINIAKLKQYQEQQRAQKAEDMQNAFNQNPNMINGKKDNVQKSQITESVGIKALFKKGDIPDSNFDAEQLKKGIRVEKEHTTSEELAKEIAKAHLSENPKYYDYLETMEEVMKKDKEARSEPKEFKDVNSYMTDVRRRILKEL
jgi:phage portal protein BeeE